MRNLIYILTIFLLSSCGRQDDFYVVTKIIDIQDTIVVNEPFDFRLILRNDSLTEMKFTIDDTVQKSLNFNLDSRCDNQLLIPEFEKRKSEKHNYKKYYLKSGDSLVYNLQGTFKQTGRFLQMEINEYGRIYRVKETNCNNMTMYFGGMWMPGDFNPLDALEGYDFGKKIFVRLDTTEADK